MENVVTEVYFSYRADVMSRGRHTPSTEFITAAVAVSIPHPDAGAMPIVAVVEAYYPGERHPRPAHHVRSFQGQLFAPSHEMEAGKTPLRFDGMRITTGVIRWGKTLASIGGRVVYDDRDDHVTKVLDASSTVVHFDARLWSPVMDPVWVVDKQAATLRVFEDEKSLRYGTIGRTILAVTDGDRLDRMLQEPGVEFLEPPRVTGHADVFLPEAFTLDVPAIGLEIAVQNWLRHNGQSLQDWPLAGLVAYAGLRDGFRAIETGHAEPLSFRDAVGRVLEMPEVEGERGRELLAGARNLLAADVEDMPAPCARPWAP